MDRATNGCTNSLVFPTLQPDIVRKYLRNTRDLAGGFEVACPKCKTATASFWQAMGGLEVSCAAGCEPVEILRAAGLQVGGGPKPAKCTPELPEEKPEEKPKPAPMREPVPEKVAEAVQAPYGEWTREEPFLYRGGSNRLTLKEVIRWRGDDFKESVLYRPGGGMGAPDWVPIDDAPPPDPVPYRLPEINAAAGEQILIAENAAEAEALVKMGFQATTNAGGETWPWPAEISPCFKGCQVAIVGRADAPAIKQALADCACEIRIVPLKLPVTEWVKNGGSADEMRRLIDLARAWKPVSLSEVIAAFQRFLFMPDPSALLVALATYAANRLPGDPVWLFVVAPPSGGKTETIGALSDLPFVHSTATITEAGLLSGTPAKDKAKGSKGGLLREVGEFGFIICKDFGSVISMHRETRAQTLAALREIFDGSWVRRLGTDGGKVLEWRGKIGLLASVTPAIDTAHAVMGLLGERFAMFRLPEIDRRKVIGRAIDLTGRESDMRIELAGIVRRFFDGVAWDQKPTPPSDADRDRLADLTLLVTPARSAVPRDSYTREISDIPATEGPARFVKTLLQLLRAFDAIGAPRDQSWPIIEKLALDCIPPLRRAALEVLLCDPEPMKTSAVEEAISCPKKTTTRALEDLTAHGVVDRISGKQGTSHRWKLTDETRSLYPRKEATWTGKSDSVYYKTPTLTDNPGQPRSCTGSNSS